LDVKQEDQEDQEDQVFTAEETWATEVQHVIRKARIPKCGKQNDVEVALHRAHKAGEAEVIDVAEVVEPQVGGEGCRMMIDGW
jgi:hypothetical protein